MKTVLLSILSVFFVLCVKAQPDDYNGPAKIAVSSFWEKAANLEKSIATGGTNVDRSVMKELAGELITARQQDRNYNTDAMAAKIKSLNQSLDKLKDEKTAAPDIKITNEAGQDKLKSKIEALLASLFDASIGDHKPDNIISKTTAYKKNTEELLSLDRTAAKATLGRYLIRLKKKAVETEKLYTGLEKVCLERTDAALVEVDYYMFLYYQAYWDAAQKLFPEEAAFSKAWSLVSTILAGLGSVEKLQALAAKNYEQRTNETRVPAAKMKDAGVEKLMMDAYNQMYSQSFDGRALLAVITSDDWTIQRNEATGIVTGRLRRGAIVYKTTAGKCFLVKEFFIQQEYVGNSFSNTKSVYAVGKGQEMRCENVR